jgi:fumarate reductase subunit C
MWTITKMFEGYFLFGKAYPGIVAVVVASIVVLLVVHAALAVRKFPINYRQYRTYRDHMKLMRHEDTTLWYWQVVTGFALFFLAAPHLFQMLTQPGLIGPFESADRVWSYRWWPLYIVLLLAVEIHGGIGLYRLAVKWGWFAGAHPDATRKRLKALKWALTAFFLVLGFATLAAYIKIGIEHADKVGERYVPASVQQGAAQPGVAK